MMKMTAVVVFAVLLLTGSAGAVTLEVTSGSYDARQSLLFDPGIRLFGQNFRIVADPNSGYGPFQPRPVSSPLTLDGVGYLVPRDGGVSIQNLRLHFDYDATSRLAELYPTHGDLVEVTESFAMTGSIDVIDAFSGVPLHFDLIGHGGVHAYWFAGDFGRPDFEVDYTFVPEPSTLTLLVGALGALLTVWRRHR